MGMIPLPAEAGAGAPGGRADGSSAAVVGRAMAMSPGRMTRNGRNIFGTAAISGVRRAAPIESAAIARWMTRKSVHQ